MTDRPARHPRLGAWTARHTRIAAVTVFSALSAASSTRIFERPELLWMVLAVVGAGVVGMICSRRSVRLSVLALGAVGVAVVSAQIAGGSPADALDGLANGWSKMLSTAWPSPTRPELVAAVGWAVMLAAGVGIELAHIGRGRATLLVPGTLLGMGFVVSAADAGPPPPALMVCWLVAAAVVLAVSGEHQPTVRGLLADGRGFVGVGLMLSLAVGGLVAWRDLRRTDPRSHSTRAVVETATLNPLSLVAAQRDVDPPVELMRVTNPPGPYLRMLSLEQYDGVSWSIRPTFSPVGRKLAPTDDGAGPTVTMKVESIGAPLSWIPTVGTPRALDRDVTADPERTMLYADPPVESGVVVQVQVRPPVADDDALAKGTSVATVEDDFSAAFQSTAERLAGSGGSTYERLRRLEAALRTDYRLNADGPAGVNAGLLRLFVETNKQGTDEQFVAAFTLMARSLGARARVAVGYLLADSQETVTTADARAWPEVWFEGIGWIAFDPVPTTTVTQLPGPATRIGVGSVPTPPLLPPPPSIEPPDSGPPVSTATKGFASRLALALTIALLSLVLLVVGVVLLAGGVIAAKHRRRRARLLASRPSDRVVGAWAEATDTLVDYGANLAHDHTNSELALVGAPVAGDEGAHALGELAHLADVAAYGRSEPDDVTVAHAVRLLGQIDQEIARRHHRLRRWRARTTVRSLAARHRSPVR